MKITRTLSSTRAPGGATIVLQEHDGQFFMRINGTTLMSTTAFASEQEMAAIACEKLPAARARVLIGGLGFGYTLRRVLELACPDASVEVAELLPEIVEWNRQYLAEVNGCMLDDVRVAIHCGDVYDRIQNCAQSCYDAVLLDVDNSPDPLVQSGNGRLYSRSGLVSIRNALRPGGRVVFWSAHTNPSFEEALRSVFPRCETVASRPYATAKRRSHTLFVADL